MAGGHNAPPRGQLVLDDDGQPVYGPRDEADLTKMVALGLPFWLAGGYGETGTGPGGPRRRRGGSAGRYPFRALAGLRAAPALRETTDRPHARSESLVVRTDALASPTGFPFKVAQLPETLTEAALYDERPRLCDLGYLRLPYVRDGGAIGYRCPAEPIDIYVRKGGTAEEAEGSKCLCNALMANVGLGQERKDGYAEEPLLTLGSDLERALNDWTPS